MPMQPIHPHDCENCEFLPGFTYEEDDKEFDFYLCVKDNGGPTEIVGRYGPEGPEYRSWALGTKLLSSGWGIFAVNRAIDLGKLTLSITPTKKGA